MKKLLPFLLMLLTVASCTTEKRYGMMRRGLDSLNVRNRNDVPFSVEDVSPYVVFFDRYGTPDDQLLAHYLLGRAYFDHHEIPMALRCFQDAVEYTDTNSRDCDFYQLSRVYSQMGVVYYHQGLLERQLAAIQQAVRYSLLAGDTTAAMSEYWMMSAAYEQLGNDQEAFEILDSLTSWYMRQGEISNAALASGRSFAIMVYLKDTKKARELMYFYEHFSGLFDKNGNIAEGREIYYHAKGLFYYDENQLDSAEYYFRKELRDGNDFNNQHAAATGLLKIFEGKHQADSVAKYASYSYAMSDSLYNEMSTEIVERMSALYDYTRHQELAKRESDRAAKETEKRNIVLAVLVLLVISFALVVYSFRKKREEDRRVYKRSIEELERVQSDLMHLRQHEDDYQQLIAQKERMIASLRDKISRYGKLFYVSSAETEKHLKSSDIYQQMEKIACRGLVPTDDDWSKIHVLVIEYLPGFNDFLVSNRYQLNLKEYHTCILLRLHFKAAEISRMLEVSSPYITQMCSRMMQKFFQEKGRTKELTTKLCEIF